MNQVQYHFHHHVKSEKTCMNWMKILTLRVWKKNVWIDWQFLYYGSWKNMYELNRNSHITGLEWTCMNWIEIPTLRVWKTLYDLNGNSHITGLENLDGNSHSTSLEKLACFEWKFPYYGTEILKWQFSHYGSGKTCMNWMAIFTL